MHQSKKKRLDPAKLKSISAYSFDMLLREDVLVPSMSIFSWAWLGISEQPFVEASCGRFSGDFSVYKTMEASRSRVLWHVEMRLVAHR